MSSAIRPVPPSLPPAFKWTEQPWGLLLQSVALAEITIHGWTTRQLAIVPGAACDAEWHQLAAVGGVQRASLAAVHQVHGASVVAAHAGTAERPRADGLVSRDPSILLTVRVADCAALLIADRRLGSVAAVHAGWRGTAAGIAGAAVARLRELHGSDPNDLVAAFGPSIGPCCYTVGPELKDAFRAAGHSDTDVDRWFRRGEGLHLDLWAANRDQLATAGVRPSSIFMSGLCTACHPEWFYSYRREGAAAGRLAAVIRAPAC